MKKIVFLVLLLIMSIVLVGCYEVDGTLVLNEDGEGIPIINIVADEIMGGDEARILAWQIDFLFPEVNLNYEKTIESVQKDFQSYLEINFEQENTIDLADSDYFNFEKKQDGTFEFIAEIPKILDSVTEDSKNDIVIRFSVILPAEIDMANSTRVDGQMVSWSISKEDLTSPTTLRAFTK
ncbi:hypothetical protein [Natronospora cellulosivora (SeqCode)]